MKGKVLRSHSKDSNGYETWYEFDSAGRDERFSPKIKPGDEDIGY